MGEKSKKSKESKENKESKEGKKNSSRTKKEARPSPEELKRRIAEVNAPRDWQKEPLDSYILYARPLNVQGGNDVRVYVRELDPETGRWHSKFIDVWHDSMIPAKSIPLEQASAARDVWNEDPEINTDYFFSLHRHGQYAVLHAHLRNRNKKDKERLHELSRDAGLGRIFRTKHSPSLDARLEFPCFASPVSHGWYNISWNEKQSEPLTRTFGDGTTHTVGGRGWITQVYEKPDLETMLAAVKDDVHCFIDIETEGWDVPGAEEKISAVVIGTNKEALPKYILSRYDPGVPFVETTHPDTGKTSRYQILTYKDHAQLEKQLLQIIRSEYDPLSLVGYNLQFDLTRLRKWLPHFEVSVDVDDPKVMSAAGQTVAMQIAGGQVIDLYNKFKDELPFLKNQKLGTVMNHFGLKFKKGLNYFQLAKALRDAEAGDPKGLGRALEYTAADGDATETLYLDVLDEIYVDAIISGNRPERVCKSPRAIADEFWKLHEMKTRETVSVSGRYKERIKPDLVQRIFFGDKIKWDVKEKKWTFDGARNIKEILGDASTWQNRFGRSVTIRSHGNRNSNSERAFRITLGNNNYFVAELDGEGEGEGEPKRWRPTNRTGLSKLFARGTPVSVTTREIQADELLTRRDGTYDEGVLFYPTLLLRGFMPLYKAHDELRELWHYYEGQPWTGKKYRGLRKLQEFMVVPFTQYLEECTRHELDPGEHHVRDVRGTGASGGGSGTGGGKDGDAGEGKETGGPFGWGEKQFLRTFGNNTVGLEAVNESFARTVAEWRRAIKTLTDVGKEWLINYDNHFLVLTPEGAAELERRKLGLHLARGPVLSMGRKSFLYTPEHSNTVYTLGAQLTGKAKCGFEQTLIYDLLKEYLGARIEGREPDCPRLVDEAFARINHPNPDVAVDRSDLIYGKNLRPLKEYQRRSNLRTRAEREGRHLDEHEIRYTLNWPWRDAPDEALRKPPKNAKGTEKNPAYDARYTSWRYGYLVGPTPFEREFGVEAHAFMGASRPVDTATYRRLFFRHYEELLGQLMPDRQPTTPKQQTLF